MNTTKIQIIYNNGAVPETIWCSFIKLNETGVFWETGTQEGFIPYNFDLYSIVIYKESGEVIKLSKN